ncbi:AfsR/SARP family transcriptional regulator [Candidatus Leptofilum sp.]|uniref:AfsR/SARP family transcriptional regulator n=1 Tax=Candidatus Leptofilum sp. TaxID=3241576 RepID=UPI003B5AC491
MNHLDVNFLGTFQIYLNGDFVSNFRSAKVQALFCYLLVEGRPVSRATLREFFWSEQPQELANANLRQSLSRLQKAIKNKAGDEPFLLVGREFVEMNQASSYWVDVHTFETLLGACEEHGRFPNLYCGQCHHHLEQAAALYQGDFLATFFLKDSPQFDAWQNRKREALHRAALETLTFLAKRLETRGDYPQAIDTLDRLLQLEPWQEATHFKKIRLLARLGRRVEAMQQYKMCCTILADEFGLFPGAELQRLVESIRQAPEKRPSNLPLSKHPHFINREECIEQINQYLFDPARRLISIIGPGGIGKTAVALEIGQALVAKHLGPFTHGVFFVQCLPNPNAERFVSVETLNAAIAAVCEITLTNEKNIADQITDALKEKELLLIIDEGEFLDPEARANLTTIIRQTTAVKIVSTSREKLNLVAEWSYRLEGLSFPPAVTRQMTSPQKETTRQDISKIKQYEAIKLFQVKAQQNDPTFIIRSREEATAVTQIVQMVEGFPLGVELAAAWVNIILPQTIALELSNSGKILASEQIDLPAKHRNMFAVFEWSWQQLSEEEKKLLKRLTIFHGGFNFEAAKEVAGASLPMLSRLSNKSWLQKKQTPISARYRLHTLIHQYLVETKVSQEQLGLGKRHSAYFANYLATIEPYGTGIEVKKSSDLIKQDIENIRAGWNWAVKQSELSLLSHYLEPLYHFYATQSWWHEGLIMFQKATLLLKQEQNRSRLSSPQLHFFAQLFTRFSEFCQALGDIEHAELVLKDSTQLNVLLEEPGEYALLNKKLGMIAHRRGHFALAEDHLQITISVLEESKPRSEDLAHAYMSLGAILRDSDDKEGARDLFAKSVSIYKACGSPWGIAHATRLLANITFQLDDISEAKEHHQESMALFKQIDNELGIGLNLIGLGQIAAKEGDGETAVTHLQQGLQICRQVDDQTGVAMALLQLGELMIAQEAWHAARKYLQDCFDLAVRLQATPIILQLLFNIALVLLKSQVSNVIDAKVSQLWLAIINHPLCVPSLKAKTERLLDQHNLKPTIEPVQSIKQIRQLVEASLSYLPP